MLPASQRSRKPSRQSHGESQGNLQISTEEAAMKQETRCSSLAPSRPSHLCFHAPTPMTYSIVKLPLRQRLGSEWAGLMCIPSPLQFAELPWSQRREGQRGTEKRASMAALHKLRGYEAGREFVCGLTIWSRMGFSSLPPLLLPVPLRADPRLRSLTHCHPWSFLRSPSSLACIHHH